LRDPSPSARDQAQLMISLIRMGWGQNEPVFRRLFTTLFIPDASREEMEWFDELQRVTADAETAVRIREARDNDDVTSEAAYVTAPTLVLHARYDALVPFSEGRLVATLIPGARFVPLEGRNHILLANERGWAQFLSEVRSFLAPSETQAREELRELSNRELDVLSLAANGLNNEEIAGRLYVSVRTVERHLSNIYAKLGVSGKAARAAAAARFSRSAEAAMGD
jgi:DNA-binding CsgD family transcriptional regulator